MSPTSEAISAAHLRGHIEALTAHGPRHFGNSTAVAAALRYLRFELEAAAGHPVTVEQYSAEPDEVNLVAELPGIDPDLPVLEVGAHWDTVEGSPGADDNASGVAGVLAIAEALAPLGSPSRGVRFCLFGGEEGPRGEEFPGSSAHLSTVDGPVVGAIVLEMIGYRTTAPGSQRVPEQLVGMIDVPDAGDFIAVLGDEGSADYVVAIEAAGRRAVPDLSALALVLPAIALPLISRSDHVPYWAKGLKGVLVTDTSEYRTPHYHRADDVLATLDLEFAARVSAMVAAAVVDLAGPWAAR
ncbi:MAG: hypothetical protein AUI14_09065 [Actinobacteria bacterium 13_2_20CM_2_71_6]|nr:MAG: hypothetical protein AUI14_09065 [Actinobacteria bacterium 13_2_20CM_2_71_6]